MEARVRAARKLGLNRCGRRNSKPQPLMKRTALSPKDSPLPRRWSAKLSRNCNHLLSLARGEKKKEGERRGEASGHPRFPFNPFVLPFIPLPLLILARHA